MGKNLLIAILGLLLAGSAWLLMKRTPGPLDKSGEQDPLAETFVEMSGDLPGVAIGFCVLDHEGEVVSQLNGGTPMIPASTFKTLTTVAALDLLGPEFKFMTKLSSAESVGGRIEGDLIIHGGGDPMLSMSDLEKWSKALKQHGVIAITGGVIGDGSLFPEIMAGDFWGWGDVGNGYGSPTSGLNLDHNRFTAAFRPGAFAGEGTEFLGARPAVPGIEWLNRVTTGAEGSGDGVVIYGGPLATRILLTGTVPPGEIFGVRGAVPDPALFTAFHFDRLLREKGVEIGLPPRADRGVEVGSEVWGDHASPSLAEILPGLHGRSDNHETECLFQMMGVEAGRPAEEVLTAYWRKRGVEDLRVVDGSGLSRADFISAEGLARVQWEARQAGAAEIYRTSLSLSHDGKVRSKIGGMSSVRSWAGYLEGASGETFSFALIFNHYRDGSRLDHWCDELLDQMLRDSDASNSERNSD